MKLDGDPQKKELIKESEWMRVYRVGEDHLRYESKFLTDGLSVSAGSIRERWATLTPQEQVEFSMAFYAKPNLTTGDEEILDFLMENGSEQVVSNIASMFTRHSDRERVFHFLASRLQRGGGAEGHWANYYQALEILGDLRAVPILRSRYEQYTDVHALEKPDLSWPELLFICDYLACCRALMKLDEFIKYEERIRMLLNHPDARIRHSAQLALSKDAP